MRWFLGIVVSIILLTWAFYDVDFHPLIETFSRISLWSVVGMIATIFLFFTFKIWRWQQLLTPVGNFSVVSLVPSTLIGTAVNYVFFGYIGEFVRTWILSREKSVSKSPVFMSIIMERIFDLWTLLLFLGVAAYISPTISPYVAKAGYAAAGLGIVATFCAVFLLFWPAKMQKFFKAVFNIFPESWQKILNDEIIKCTKGLRSIAHSKTSSIIILASLGQWAAMCASNWIAATAVGITVPPWALLGPMGLMILGMTLPSTPGQLGVIEISYVIGLLPWGVPKEQALAAGLLFHAVLYISVITVAMVISKSLNISWNRE
jgi:hypothetical protein